MKYTTRMPIDYIRAGTGDLCDRLGIRLVALRGGHTEIHGSPFSMISFFTAMAEHYRWSLREIRQRFV